MNRVMHAMPVMLRTSMATMLQYRGEILLWSVWGLVFPAVSIAMWSAAARGGMMGSFDRGDIAAYFFLTMVLGHLATSWDIFEMGWVVRTGALSPRLLLPMHPIWARIADNIAYKVVTMIFVVPIWAAVIWYVRPTFDTSVTDVLLGVPIALLSIAVTFVWGYVGATMAFYITKMDALGELYLGAALFFGGRFAAIEWLPAPLRWISAALPFRWSMAFPIELFMGRLNSGQIMVGCAWLVTWFVVGIVALKYFWAKGLKRYSAVGA